ncbi:ribonuclease P protein component [Sulfuricella denitrificans]|uniref:ribonuclease P protein component n=1 Tax=Sulfuricella denitrificans TaxID=649841 RepID=UPI0005A0304E|nr:ribonuclease P protein component [Sulfuricella denitrificans]
MPATHAFQKSKRLKETDEISSVFSFKCQVYGDYLRILAKPNELNHPRFTGIIRKKTASHAVTRNYIKRSLREIFRRHQNLFDRLDIVVLAHKSFTGNAFHQVEAEFLRLMDNLQKRLVQR